MASAEMAIPSLSLATQPDRCAYSKAKIGCDTKLPHLLKCILCQPSSVGNEANLLGESFARDSKPWSSSCMQIPAVIVLLGREGASSINSGMSPIIALSSFPFSGNLP